MRLRMLATGLAVLVCALWSGAARASDPFSAVYSTEDDNIFWFVLTADVHIGAQDGEGEENLRWLLNEGREVIAPSFIVVAGDLTDSTNWSNAAIPDGPHDSEWLRYREIVEESGVTPDLYYDLPGNHDHFGDRTFERYLDYSLMGSTSGQTQASWTRTFDFGKYHFLGVNTCGNDGIDFSTLPPTYGDNAGLDEDELRFIEESLEAHRDASLTMVFGHHLIYKREIREEDFAPGELEKPTMTALSYGADEFAHLLDRYGAVLYGYGHTHTPMEEFLVKEMDPGVIYLNTASLAKSKSGHYRIVAVDNNGVSTVSLDAGTWPAVIVTAPLDRNLGMEDDPYTSRVPDLTGGSTPIRALVFDKEPVERVEYTMYRIDGSVGQFLEAVVSGAAGRVDEAAWNPMARVPAGHPLYPYLWEADCPNPLAGGDYTVEVRATGSSTRSDRVPTAFPAEPVSGTGCFLGATLCGGGAPAQRPAAWPLFAALLFLAGALPRAPGRPPGARRRSPRLFPLGALFLASCAPLRPHAPAEARPSGREQLLAAVRPGAVTGSLVARSGLAATALSSGNLDLTNPLKALDPEGSHGGVPFRHVAQDGTVVEGLLFAAGGDPAVAKPLLIASFGLLQDRWGSEPAKFRELYLSDPAERLPADVLVLDHPTAGPFLANNGFLSLGAYDDGRLWIEVAERLRRERKPPGIHLLGVSMSGQTVIHALVEDERLGLGLFRSGVALSVAPDFREAPGRQLGRLKTRDGVPNPWKPALPERSGNPAVHLVQGWGIEVLMARQFVPSYRRASARHQELRVATEDIAVFLRKACEDRLRFLREHPSPTWDRERVRLDDLDSFMDSTRVAGIVGRVRTPLVLVSSRDDPAVDSWMFQEVAAAAAPNPWVVAYETDQGGHFGFDVAYGKGYVRRILELALDPWVVSRWNVAPPEGAPPL